jgi:hypothetical protein
MVYGLNPPTVEAPMFNHNKQVHYVNEVGALVNLLAGVVEQARKDATMHTVQPPTTCPIDYPHSCRRCAREFLAALDAEIQASPKMQVYELAQTVLEIIE